MPTWKRTSVWARVPGLRIMGNTLSGAQAMAELTTLIQLAHQGDAAAGEAAYKLLYGDLTKLARARLARSGRNTLLDTSALVNEAYLRLAGAESFVPEDRYCYLAYASRAMRSVIVDLVRARSTERRGS